jgi:hypothetical protein
VGAELHRIKVRRSLASIVGSKECGRRWAPMAYEGHRQWITASEALTSYVSSRKVSKSYNSAPENHLSVAVLGARADVRRRPGN